MSSRSPYLRVELPIRKGGSFSAKALRFRVGEYFVDICTSSALCLALKTDLAHLRKLECVGFPAPLWVVKGKKRWARWYSTKQITVIVEIASRCTTRGRLSTKRFIEAVNKVFYTIDIPRKELFK